jgi:hypothetical protein
LARMVEAVSSKKIFVRIRLNWVKPWKYLSF